MKTKKKTVVVPGTVLDRVDLRRVRGGEGTVSPSGTGKTLSAEVIASRP
jgi:hypothetical protein